MDQGKTFVQKQKQAEIYVALMLLLQISGHVCYEFTMGRILIVSSHLVLRQPLFKTVPLYPSIPSCHLLLAFVFPGEG
jgi:hypothetical protein